MTLPYNWYPAVLHAINELGQGHTLSTACDIAGIEIVQFRAQLKRDPALQEMYEDAQQRSYDAMADALINIDNHKIHGQSDAKMAKVISDNIKWVLARRNAKNFGDKIEVKHEFAMDRAITDALNAAKTRGGAPQITHTIEDAVVIEDDDAAIMRQLLG